METPKNYTEGLNLNILFGNLSIRVSTLVKTQPDPGWHVYPHSHFDYEFHIIPRGKGIIRIQGSEFTVTGGEFYITGPQIIHEQISDAQDPMEEYCLECEIMAVDGIPDAYALPLQQERLLTDILSQPYSRPFRDTAGIAGRFEALFREVEEEPAGFFLKLQ
ncbi:MAG: AraC family ligand binding domain-containing protein, partial [Clostridia bacterium]|nr:AraC family ligand binding domain-containing protein [Clostridia bacterium]